MRESPLHRGRGTGGEMLTDWKLERYRRQIALFGEEAQERLAGGADLIVDADSFGVRCIFNGAVSGFDGQATTIIPVVGTTPWIVGPVRANEAIEYITGTDDLLANRLLVWDGRAATMTTLPVERQGYRRTCGNGRSCGR